MRNAAPPCGCPIEVARRSGDLVIGNLAEPVDELAELLDIHLVQALDVPTRTDQRSYHICTPKRFEDHPSKLAATPDRRDIYEYVAGHPLAAVLIRSVAPGARGVAR